MRELLWNKISAPLHLWTQTRRAHWNRARPGGAAHASRWSFISWCKPKQRSADSLQWSWAGGCWVQLGSPPPWARSPLRWFIAVSLGATQHDNSISCVGSLKAALVTDQESWVTLLVCKKKTKCRWAEQGLGCLLLKMTMLAVAVQTAESKLWNTKSPLIPEQRWQFILQVPGAQFTFPLFLLLWNKRKNLRRGEETVCVTGSVFDGEPGCTASFRWGLFLLLQGKKKYQ